MAEAKKEEYKLPAYFDVATAAGIVGAEKAQSFFDEVSMITSGDLSAHNSPGVSFKSMELSADDAENPSAKDLQVKLKRVRALFVEKTAEREAEKTQK